jgi:hypothetical protein
VTVSWHESPTGSISQVTLEVPSLFTSSERYLVEAIAEPVEDYVAVSHAGHGVNSYGLNFHLVYGPIAVFAQTGWAGVYTNADEAAADVTRQFTQCADLIATAEASAERMPAAQPREPFGAIARAIQLVRAAT